MHNATIDFYNKNFKDYCDATLNIKKLDLWEIALSHIPQDARILDLGCGAGRDILYFSAYFSRVYGLDLSFNFAQFAYQNSLKPVVQADLRHLPFHNRSFDVIWSIASLLHLRKSEIQSALLESNRVLRINGLMFISLKKGKGERVADDGRFFSYYSEKELSQLLSNVGFNVVDVFLTYEKKLIKKTNQSVTVPWVFTVSQKISEEEL